MNPVLILQFMENDAPAYLGTWLVQRGITSDLRLATAIGGFPERIDGYSALALLGGSMSANDDLPWIDDELALMRDADQLGVPIIGHCLGGQLLAKALGALVRPNAMKEIGWSEVEVDNAELAREWIGNEPAFELFQWHGDTFDLPAGARRFLTSRLCANQAFVVDREPHAHLGMQFHVEMTPQLVNAWVTDPRGAHEIDEAFQRQGGSGVQRVEEIVLNVDERVQRMSRLADRIYQRWLRGTHS